MKISHNLTTTSIALANNKNPAQTVTHQNAPAQWLTQATEVYISQSGQELNAASRLRADHDTGAESSLDAIQAKKAQIASDKKRIDEINATLNNDDGQLTDNDRASLQKERETLVKRSQTPEDLMHTKYQEINHWEKLAKATPEAQSIAAEQINRLEKEIHEQKDIVKQQGQTETALQQKALQERMTQDDQVAATLAKQSSQQAATQASQTDALQAAATTATHPASLLDTLTGNNHQAATTHTKGTDPSKNS